MCLSISFGHAYQNGKEQHVDATVILRVSDLAFDVDLLFQEHIR